MSKQYVLYWLAKFTSIIQAHTFPSYRKKDLTKTLKLNNKSGKELNINIISDDEYI